MKSVIVNKGLSKKGEKELNERLDELEEKVESQDKDGRSRRTTPEPAEYTQFEPTQQGIEDQVRAAAVAYYQAVARASSTGIRKGIREASAPSRST